MDSLFADFSSLAAMSREKAEKNMQEALNYLGLDMKNIAKTMRPYHPLEMLKMAAWEERRISRTKNRDEFQGLYAHLLPVLLQSILQSTLYDTSYPASTNRDIKQKDWNRVLSLAEDTVKRLLRYIESYTVYAVRSGLVSEENAESYRAVLTAQFFPPEESHGSIEKYACLWYGYAFDDEKIIKEKFGTDLRTLVSGIEKIAVYGLEGIDKLSEDFSVYKAEMLLLMARKRAEEGDSGRSDDDIRDEIVRENKWEMRVRDLQGRRDDFDLFRPEFAADLPSDVYQSLSRPIGSLDISEYLRKGLWPATVFPFVRFGSMYFSFVQSHILSYGQRILALNAGLYLRDSAAAAAACRLLFSETDTVGVYSFDGNKVDISILSSVTEVNAVENPAFYESRVHQHEEDKHVKPQDGHKLLILDPDSSDPLELVSDGVFSSSVYYLIKAANSPEGREEFHRTIFGSLEFPEKTEILDYLDEDDIDDKEVVDDVDDEISDEYEYDREDDDEKAKAIAEKEKALDESPLPEYHQVSPSEEEIRRLQDKYELTSELIKKDEESDAEADEYEKELDDDDYSYEEGDVLPPDDEDEIEDEELYDEVEKEDLYQKESPYDSDQADLFEGLFDNPEEETESELETEEVSQEEEAEYEEEESEASDFATAYIKEQEARHEEEAPDWSAAPESVHEPMDQESSSDDYVPTAIYESDETSEDEEYPDDTQASSIGCEESSADSVSCDAADDDHEAEENPEAISEDGSDIEQGPEDTEEAACSPESSLDDTEESAAADSGIDEGIEESSETISEDGSMIPDSDIEQGPEDAEEAVCSPESSLDDAEESAAADSDIDEGIEESSETIFEDGSMIPDSDIEHGSEDAEEAACSPEAASETPDAEPERAAMADVSSDGGEDADDTVSEHTDADNVSDMVDRGVIKRSDDGSGEGSVFVMVGNGDGTAADDFSDLSGVLKDIAAKVGAKSTFVDFIRSSGPDMQSYLEDVIRRSWNRQKEDGKDKMFSIFDYSLSILIATPKVVMDDIRREEILNNAGAVMYSRHAGSWNALVLSFDDDFILLSAEERKITPSSFSPSNWKICRIVGEQLIARGK